MNAELVKIESNTNTRAITTRTDVITHPVTSRKQGKPNQEPMEFYYFKIRFWRGDVPRILFHLGNFNCKDHELVSDSFEQARDSGVLPFGKVPVLKLSNGLVLSQSVGIIRFLGLETGFYPADPLEAARVDEPILMIEEMTTIVYETTRLPDDQKEAVRTKYVDTVMARVSGNLDKLIGEKKFITGDEMTVADMIIWSCYKWYEEGNMQYIPTTLTERHENLKRLMKNVEAYKDVAAWLKVEKLNTHSV